MADWITGTAIILKSIVDPDGSSQMDGDGTSRDDGLLSLLIDSAGEPYELLLEVQIAGAPPSQVSVRSKVPPKVRKVGLFQEVDLPTTLDVPVRVRADDPTKVAVDWAAFLALPDRVPRLKAALARSQANRVQQLQAADPEKYTALQQTGHGTAMSWAESVRGGAMTRAQYETNGAGLIRVGMMTQASYDAGLARIDEP